jgi:ribonuclease D
MDPLVTSEQIRTFCAQARDARVLALDMEFERERSYRAILQLIQVATPDTLALIDPLSDADLGPLWEIIADPTIEIVVHAGSQDMEIFHDHAGEVPRGVFDTQVAAALLGMGEQPGYADLVRRVLDVRLKKGERTTRWGQRPLTAAQTEYALDDVRHLLPLRQELHERLERAARLAWLEEELVFYSEEGTYVHDPQFLWMRVSRHRSLSPRRLAVLRELAIWRENEAANRNTPRNRVAPDDVLVDIARRLPREPRDLDALRRLHPREARRSGAALVEAVLRGLEVPEAEQPRLPPLRDEDKDLELTVDLVSLYVRHRARDAQIASSYLGTKKDVSQLVYAVRAGRWEKTDLKLLSGWRRDLVGDDLLRILRGELTLAVETGSGYLRPLRKGETLPVSGATARSDD